MVVMDLPVPTILIKEGATAGSSTPGTRPATVLRCAPTTSAPATASMRSTG